MEDNVACIMNVTYAKNFPEVKTLDVFGVLFTLYSIDPSSLSSTSSFTINANIDFEKTPFPMTIRILRNNYDYTNTSFYGYTVYAPTLQINGPKYTSRTNGFDFGGTVLFDKTCDDKYPNDLACQLFSNLRDTVVFDMVVSLKENDTLDVSIRSLTVVYSDTKETQTFERFDDLLYNYRHSPQNGARKDNILYAVRTFESDCIFQNIFRSSTKSCRDLAFTNSHVLWPVVDSIVALPSFEGFDLLNTRLVQDVYQHSATWQGDIIRLVNDVLKGTTSFQDFHSLYLLTLNGCPNLFYDPSSPSPCPPSPSPCPSYPPSTPVPTCPPSLPDQWKRVALTCLPILIVVVVVLIVILMFMYKRSKS